MIYRQNGGEVEIGGVSDFIPERIFECGQCFRWNVQPDGCYIGVAKGKAARVRTDGGKIYISGTIGEFEEIWRGYFDLDRDYAAIREKLVIDDYMERAAAFGAGIRILRQDRWEALCSFIISQCNNINRIKGIIERFCSNFGEPFVFEGKPFFTFPEAEKVAVLEPEQLEPIRCGYRAPFIIAAAREVASGAVCLDGLAEGDAVEALKRLKELPGVGDKVANCALLFGLQKLDAFPVDVWMGKAIREHYGDGFDPAVFGEYSGLAQQYMFYFARSGEKSALKKAKNVL